jgi:glycosyltransferase involved in cell wall biosynthesis
MDNSKPLVSIITPTFNRGSFLEKIIQSIASQGYDNIEYVVVDGGSSDNTIEILKKYEGRYNLRWISEKDKGQADATNKGLKMAKGEIIGLCNSDDFYAEGAIKKIVKVFIENPDIDLVFGACQEFDYKTNQLSTIYRISDSGVLDITADNFFTGKKTIFQPSMFYRKEIIEKTGPMNIKYKFVIEPDWWFRMFKSHAKIFYLDEILAIIGHHEDRGCVEYAAVGIKESMDFIKSHGGPIPINMKLSYLRWKYPRISNFFKIQTPNFYSAIKKIIYKI